VTLGLQLSVLGILGTTSVYGSTELTLPDDSTHPLILYIPVSNDISLPNSLFLTIYCNQKNVNTAPPVQHKFLWCHWFSPANVSYDGQWWAKVNCKLKV